MKKILFAVIIFLLTAQEVDAQLRIGKFYSTGSPDWVEVVNETENQINFSEYLIYDVADNKLTKNIFIPAKGSCVFEWGNKLNNKGDIIFLKRDVNLISCVKYGEDVGGICDDIGESEQSETKPEQNCFEATPTPAPTVFLTAPPRPVYTPTPTLAPTPIVLAKSTEKPKTTPPRPSSNIEEGETDIDSPSSVEGARGSNNTANISLGLGAILIAGSGVVIAKKEYNERHLSKKT